MTKKRILGCLRVPPVEYHCSRPTSAFKETHKLCALVQPLPSMTVSIECSLSLTRIKDHKHNNVKSDRLTGLTLMATDEFVMMKQRLDFTYK
jgi:hypothetical protein